MEGEHPSSIHQFCWFYLFPANCIPILFKRKAAGRVPSLERHGSALSLPQVSTWWWTPLCPGSSPPRPLSIPFLSAITASPCHPDIHLYPSILPVKVLVARAEGETQGEFVCWWEFVHAGPEPRPVSSPLVLCHIPCLVTSQSNKFVGNYSHSHFPLCSLHSKLHRAQVQLQLLATWPSLLKGEEFWFNESLLTEATPDLTLLSPCLMYLL